jgi:hypothetical protein
MLEVVGVEVGVVGVEVGVVGVVISRGAINCSEARGEACFGSAGVRKGVDLTGGAPLAAT